MDFTLTTYRNLLEVLKENNSSFFPFIKLLTTENLQRTTHKATILRHDVDRRPQNALLTAKIENEFGIKGSYYFRIVRESFDEEIIKKISDMGHEIGYHYEEMDTVSSRFGVQRSEGELIDAAWELFKTNLGMIRKVAEVTTICPHGSPLSRFDNKIIWDKYNYKELGIIGDATINTDWNEFGYLTDTGRRWNGDSISVRDKVQSNNNINVKSTFDIINNIDNLPDKIMITIHPERWNENYLLWLAELIGQNFKNVIKKHFFVKKNFG